MELLIYTSLFLTLVSFTSLIYFLNKPKSKPRCFKSNPGYQSQAENCCDDCPVNKECL